MEIILLRHGKPDVKLSGNVNSVTLKVMADEYENSGVSAGEEKPENKLSQMYREIFNHSCFYVCSNLKRSQESAKLLGFANVDMKDSLFNESDIPLFNRYFIIFNKIKLPVLMWVIILRLLWLFGFKQNGESIIEAKKRAEIAANKLIGLAYEHKKVVLIGHGLFNRLIANQLRRKDWQGPKSPGKKFWQSGVYRYSLVDITE